MVIGNKIVCEKYFIKKVGNCFYINYFNLMFIVV